MTLLVTLAASAGRSERRGPSGRVLGTVWLALVGLPVAGVAALVVLGGAASVSVLVPVAALGVLLLVPGLLAVLPDWSEVDTGARRKAGVAGLVVVAVLVALPSVLLSSVVVGADPVPNDDGITVGGYDVTYAEDASSAQELFGVQAGNDSSSTVTGVILVDEDRELWTVGVQDRVLRHEGNGTVAVGGVAWHESVRAERTAWEVVGNDTAYAVDLHHDGERTRSFATDPVVASAEVAGATVAVAPTETGFELRVLGADGVVDAVPVPARNESTTVGDLELSVESDGEIRRIYAAGPDSRALVAVEETY